MKRIPALFALVVLLSALFTSVALAKTIIGNNGENTLTGTNRADTIDGRGGQDSIFGRGGQDTLIGGTGEDSIFGGRGADHIRAVDKSEDTISCGAGIDRVRANPGDRVASDCEKVVREGSRVDDHGGGHGRDDSGGDI